MKTLLTLLTLVCLAYAGENAVAAQQPAAATPDGGRYYGALRDGTMHGRGRIEWPNGTYYEGHFDKGLFSARGVRKLGPGHVYKGAFRRGLMHGHGRLRQPDGGVYVGEFRNDFFHGEGRFEDAAGDVFEGTFRHGSLHGPGRMSGPEGSYSGEFRFWHFWGKGERVYSDGRKYRGAFVRGRMHGPGRYETPRGDVYEGEFADDDFTGTGTRTSSDGTRHEGRFVKWLAEGPGRSTTKRGDVYEGTYADDRLEGRGRLVTVDGGRYEGEFRDGRFHGQGTLTFPNGDVYTGGFEYGTYEGQGTLSYGKPAADGPREVSGLWRYGRLQDEEAEQRARLNVETALYNQRALLDRALAALAPRDPAKINMYLLAVAGDGSQEVFRREVEFVRTQFDRAFGTGGRSIALINSRNTVDSAPMATVSSIREALGAIAARMDTERDVLFLFLTSHGSEKHEFTLSQNRMGLRGLGAPQLAGLLAEAGIRWKVVVVSACYSGGFIGPLQNDETLVITAARHDRRSFGCADDNDFTYFGRAYFKEALPRSASFHEAFEEAARLVGAWERDPAITPGAKGREADLSLPQISAPERATEHLRRWWKQLTPPPSAAYNATSQTP